MGAVIPASMRHLGGGDTSKPVEGEHSDSSTYDYNLANRDVTVFVEDGLMETMSLVFINRDVPIEVTHILHTSHFNLKKHNNPQTQFWLRFPDEMTANISSDLLFYRIDCQAAISIGGPEAVAQVPLPILLEVQPEQHRELTAEEKQRYEDSFKKQLGCRQLGVVTYLSNGPQETFRLIFYDGIVSFARCGIRVAVWEDPDNTGTAVRTNVLCFPTEDVAIFFADILKERQMYLQSRLAASSY
jgi:hypothetical protein